MTHEFKNLNMKDADVWYCPDLFGSDHKTWYELVDTSVDWQKFQVMVYGKSIPQPRDSFYMADNGYPYKYSGIDRPAEDWSTSITIMKDILDECIQEIRPGHPKLNGCLGNRYQNGHQYIGAHSDSEGDLNLDAFIVSVSLGAPRDFVFTHKKTKDKVKILLQPGSVLLMGKGCQKNWKHEVPKRLRLKDPRINLTYRSILMRERSKSEVKEAPATEADSENDTKNTF